MATFVLSYRSPHGYTPSPESRAEWTAWFDGMNGSLVDMGKPVVGRTSLGARAPQSLELGGYSVISADDMAGALAIAEKCPHLQRGGGVEVGELGEVPAP